MEIHNEFTLFGEHPTKSYLAPKYNDALKRAQNYPIAKLRERELDFILSDILRLYDIEIPTIDTAEGSVKAETREVDTGSKSPMLVVTFYFPFTGDASIFKCNVGNTFTLRNCWVEKRGEKNVLACPFPTGYFSKPLPEDRQKQAKNAGQEYRRQIVELLPAFQKEVDELHNAIRKDIEPILKQRLELDDKTQSGDENMGF